MDCLGLEIRLSVEQVVVPTAMTEELASILKAGSVSPWPTSAELLIVSLDPVAILDAMTLTGGELSSEFEVENARI